MDSSDLRYFIALPIDSICCILSTIMTLRIFHSMCMNEKKHTSTYYTLYITSITSSTVGIYNGTIHLYLSYFVNSNLLENKYINMFDDILHFIASNSFYIIVLLNVQNLFKNTLFSISQPTLSFLSILILFQTIAYLWYILSDFYSIFAIYHFPLFCLIGFNFILNSNIIILFAVKLKTLGVLEHNDLSIRSIVDIIIKYTILFCVVICINEIFYATLFIDNLFEWQFWHGFYVFIMRSIQHLSNILALYLTFICNDKIYYKICSCLHGFTRKCCLCNSNDKNSNVRTNMVAMTSISNATVDSKTDENPQQNGKDLVRFKSIVRFALNLSDDDMNKFGSGEAENNNKPSVVEESISDERRFVE
eukprot:70035_1